MTDIREAAKALLAGEIYDVEQKIYSDLHLEYELFEGVRDAALEFGHTADGIYICPAGEDLPVCIIELASRAEGADQAVFSFDAPVRV